MRFLVVLFLMIISYSSYGVKHSGQNSSPDSEYVKEGEKYPSVGCFTRKVRGLEGEIPCGSGTLVKIPNMPELDGRVVLTAAHVLLPWTPLEFCLNGQRSTGKLFVPQDCPLEDLTSSINDIGIFFLESPIDAPMAYLNLAAFDKTFKTPDENFTLVGFGTTGHVCGKTEVITGEKRAGFCKRIKFSSSPGLLSCLPNDDSPLSGGGGDGDSGGAVFNEKGELFAIIASVTTHTSSNEVVVTQSYSERYIKFEDPIISDDEKDKYCQFQKSPSNPPITHSVPLCSHLLWLEEIFQHCKSVVNLQRGASNPTDFASHGATQPIKSSGTFTHFGNLPEDIKKVCAFFKKEAPPEIQEINLIDIDDEKSTKISLAIFEAFRREFQNVRHLKFEGEKSWKTGLGLFNFEKKYPNLCKEIKMGNLTIEFYWGGLKLQFMKLSEGSGVMRVLKPQRDSCITLALLKRVLLDKNPLFSAESQALRFEHLTSQATLFLLKVINGSLEKDYLPNLCYLELFGAGSRERYSQEPIQGKFPSIFRAIEKNSDFLKIC